VEELKALTLACGADDAGVVNLDDPLLAVDRPFINIAFPQATIAVAIVCRMNRGNIRSPARSIANSEFHHVSDDVNEVAHELVQRLEDMGIAAMNPPMAFPMEMDNYPGRAWLVSHKLVAEAAGLGKRGIHRSVIHPKYGSFVLLGTVLVALDVDAPATTLDYNPCFECKLCVAACPVGAIKPDGHFDFTGCLNHNYQQFRGGFAGWVEDIADSRSADDYSDKHPLSETVKRWQSLSYGPQYNAAYCVAVCPAGEDVLGPYLASAKTHVEAFVKPLQDQKEPLYVVRHSDAADHAARKYPHKTLRYVRSAARVGNIPGFLFGMNLSFQRGKAKGVDATYQFIFTGEGAAEATVTIRNQRITIDRALTGTPDVVITADGPSWIKFMNRRLSLPRAILQRKIRIKGSPKLMKTFANCFPR
jgi:NAD-dependent dihydropyrimidine dehydrogenase PreA subunit